jgi:hypothetical protein
MTEACRTGTRTALVALVVLCLAAVLYYPSQRVQRVRLARLGETRGFVSLLLGDRLSPPSIAS